MSRFVASAWMLMALALLAADLGQPGLAAALVIAVVAAVVAVVFLTPPVPGGARCGATYAARVPAYLRLSDPDAAGHARPRAPSALPRAA